MKNVLYQTRVRVARRSPPLFLALRGNIELEPSRTVSVPPTVSRDIRSRQSFNHLSLFRYAGSHLSQDPTKSGTSV
jgi:hypothetical protein